MALKSRYIIGLSCLAVWLITPHLHAQNRGVQHLHEMLLLDVDNAATKKFTTAQTHLRVGQLREAIELLHSIGDAHVGKLVAVGQGRYVNVQSYAQMLSVGLSPEGLRIYRQELDPVLRPVFDTAKNTLDETQLQHILQRGYCCSFADDALLLLGDLAWDAGDVWRARSYWEQLLPPPPPKKPGDPVLWLAYPDSDLDQSLILGRLILCSIQAGQRSETQKELAEFARRHPDAKGTLAGKTGNLLAILQSAAKEAESWREPVQTNVVETFAGSPQRFHHEPEAVELGRLRWKAGLKPFGEESRRGFLQAALGGLCYFPVVYGDVVLVNDDDHIYAYRLQTGKAAWSEEPGDVQIYSSGIDHHEGGNPQRGFGEALQGNIGLPRFTMTIADGRLYARMGSVQPYTGDRGGMLVCLDLAHGEAKPIWETFASSIDPENGGWIFEGSPLVVGGRVYVGLRRLNPQPQANVACFDALTGKLIWNRKLCVGQTNPNFSDFDVNQHLLTWGEGTLYYTTHMGAVAAVDPRQGTVKWIISYPRVEDTKLRHELIARLQRGPLPAMFSNGVLYTAPLDSDELLAIDAETGLLKWRRSFTQPVQCLLGVAKGLVYASGAELWAISADNGQIAWKKGDPDPESHGFGRGILVDDLIYWPTHEEIFLVDQETGALRQRLPLFAVHGQYGGNLTLSDHHILVAQPNGLAVFSGRGPPPDRSKSVKPEFTRKDSPARHEWDLARHAAEELPWDRAAEQFQLVGKLATPDDEWMARPLSDVALEREIDARLRHAWSLTQTDPSAANKALLQAIEAATRRVPTDPRPALRQDHAASGMSSPQDNCWRLRTPGTVPEEMRNWISQQICEQLNSPALTNLSGSSPLIEQWVEAGAYQTRSIARHRLQPTDESVASRQLQSAEHLVPVQPERAAADLRRLSSQLPTPEERVRAWSGVARALEAQQAWGTASDAWKQAARVGSADTVIADAGRNVPLADLIRERFEQPEYLEQQALTATDQFPCPLRRHWEQVGGEHARTVYPEGLPPAVGLACVLLDRPPVSCLNLTDGTVRWQVTLSHPLLWAGFVSEYLILATEIEVRVVSVRTGELIWQQRLSSSESPSGAPLRGILTLEQSGTTSPGSGSSDAGLSDDSGRLSEFALSGETLLARHGSGRIVAWNVLEGRLVWQFAALRGLTAGWALTSKHVIVSQKNPAGMVVLNRADGQELARYSAESSPWIRSPVVRENGTLLTVGLGGIIESWSQPGESWQSDREPRTWTWNGPVSQSVLPPDVLSYGRISLLLLDGRTLVAVDSIQGNTLWKTSLGTSPFDHARSAICCDDERVFVAADGMLRAFDIHTGGLDWEQSLGSSDLQWKSCVRGATIVAYPAISPPAGVEGRIALCESGSGRFVQRLQLPVSGAAVQVHATAHTTLVACGGTLYGLGR